MTGRRKISKPIAKLPAEQREHTDQKAEEIRSAIEEFKAMARDHPKISLGEILSSVHEEHKY